MRLLAIATVLALSASPALACGSQSNAASAPDLTRVVKAEPSKQEKAQQAAAVRKKKAVEAAMIRKGYEKIYSRCGGGYSWIKKPSA